MDPFEKERYEQQVRENSIRMQIPYGIMADTNVNEVISRAALISDFILNGQRPVLTPRAPGE